MVIASRDQCGAGGRAKGSRVELGVAQASIRNTVERRSRDDAAKGPTNAVTLIVGHYQQHVGRALWRYDARGPPCLGAVKGLLNHSPERWRRCGELISWHRHRGAGTTEDTVDLLCHRRTGHQDGRGGEEG